MSNEDEAAYMRGYRAAQIAVLNECLRGLDMTDPIAEAAAFVEERLATIAYLRRVCAEYGDNDWPDDLALPDIIEKHLLCYMGNA